jgi:ribonuclease P protein component
MLTYRLKPVKGKNKIDLIFKHAFKFYENDAVIFVTYLNDGIERTDSACSIEFLVAVRKKDAKKAIMRNRIKRLLRESIRQEFNEFSDREIATRIESFAIIWGKIPQKASLIKLNDVKPVVSRLLLKATEFRKRSN